MLYFTKRKIRFFVRKTDWFIDVEILRHGALMQSDSVSQRLKMCPPVKQFRIGEVAHYSGLSRQTVHNYTIMGLIREVEWTDGGHRLYPESVFSRLALIDQLKKCQTLRQIRQAIDSYDEEGAELPSQSEPA